MLFTNLISSHKSDCKNNRKEKFRRRSAGRRAARRSSSAPRFELLEGRAMMAVLAVDIGDSACGDAGDNLYCEIQEAVDVAEAGDNILVQNGTYEAISIDVDDLSIQAVGGGDVIIDATGAESGVLISADGVAIRGLTVENAVEDGFAIRGDFNPLGGQHFTRQRRRRIRHQGRIQSFARQHGTPRQNGLLRCYRGF